MISIFYLIIRVPYETLKPWFCYSRLLVEDYHYHHELDRCRSFLEGSLEQHMEFCKCTCTSRPAVYDEYFEQKVRLSSFLKSFILISLLLQRLLKLIYVENIVFFNIMQQETKSDYLGCWWKFSHTWRWTGRCKVCSFRGFRWCRYQLCPFLKPISVVFHPILILFRIFWPRHEHGTPTQKENECGKFCTSKFSQTHFCT